MQPQAPELRIILARLERLERQYRLWRFGTITALLILVIVVCLRAFPSRQMVTGAVAPSQETPVPQETKRLDRLEQALVQLAAAPRPKVLEAELILIRDTNGTVRAAVGPEIPHQGWAPTPVFPPGTEDEVKLLPHFGFYLYNESGEEVAHINAADGYPQLQLSGKRQQAFALLQVTDEMAGFQLQRDETNRAEYTRQLQAMYDQAVREKWSRLDRRYEPREHSEQLQFYVSPKGYEIQAWSKQQKVRANFSESGWHAWDGVTWK